MCRHCITGGSEGEEELREVSFLAWEVVFTIVPGCGGGSYLGVFCVFSLFFFFPLVFLRVIFMLLVSFMLNSATLLATSLFMRGGDVDISVCYFVRGERGETGKHSVMNTNPPSLSSCTFAAQKALHLAFFSLSLSRSGSKKSDRSCFLYAPPHHVTLLYPAQP